GLRRRTAAKPQRQGPQEAPGEDVRVSAVPQNDQVPQSRDASERPMADDILARAATLFSELGYNAVGIRDLAAAVGLSASTLYHLYRTKRAIRSAITSSSLAEFCKRQLPRLRAPSVPPRQRLERAVTDHVMLTVTRSEELLAGNPVLNALTPDQQARVAA